MKNFLPPERLAVRSTGFGRGYWSTFHVQYRIYGDLVVSTKSHRSIQFRYRYNGSCPIIVGNLLHHSSRFQMVQLLLDGLFESLWWLALGCTVSAAINSFIVPYPYQKADYTSAADSPETLAWCTPSQYLGLANPASLLGASHNPANFDH